MRERTSRRRICASMYRSMEYPIDLPSHSANSTARRRSMGGRIDLGRGDRICSSLGDRPVTTGGSFLDADTLECRVPCPPANIPQAWPIAGPGSKSSRSPPETRPASRFLPRRRRRGARDCVRHRGKPRQPTPLVQQGAKVGLAPPRSIAAALADRRVICRWFHCLSPH